jgi:hypothetical protein
MMGDQSGAESYLVRLSACEVTALIHSDLK